MGRTQPGRDAQARERRQIVAGLLAAIEDLGPYAVRESDVIEAGGISVRTFRNHFDDLDACFDFACEASLDTLLTPMVASWSMPRSPGNRLDAAVTALLNSLTARPRLAELCLLHSPARQRDRHTYRRAVNALAELLTDARGRPAAAGASNGEAALSRRAIGVIAARLAEGGAGDLERLRPRLLALLLPAAGLDDGPR